MKDVELKMRMKAHSEKMKTSIEAPFDINQEIQKMEGTMMKRNRSTKRTQKVLYSAASVAAAFVLIFNCIPGLAYAVSDIPILGTAVKIVTFGRFEIREKNYEANVVTPKIEGLLNKELEEKLNKEFQENANSVIAAFESDIKALKEEFGNDNFHLGVEANYTVRTDNEDILAIDSYIVNTVASSSTMHTFYTIDKKTGALIELDSLFKEGADYVTPISEFIREKMRNQNESGSGFFWLDEEDIAPFENIKEDQKFFINDSGNIVICFDKYEVAAGAQGCPEFEIPADIIADIQ